MTFYDLISRFNRLWFIMKKINSIWVTSVEALDDSMQNSFKDCGGIKNVDLFK